MLKLVVFSCLVALAASSAVVPWGGVVPLAYGYGSPYLGAYNYRGPLSLAPGQPANILGADGRPLDTLDVNIDRAAHLTAKAFPHLLKKRSVAVVAPIARLPLSAISYPYTAPLAYTSPLTYSSSLAYTSPLAYRHGFGAPIIY